MKLNVEKSIESFVEGINDGEVIEFESKVSKYLIKTVLGSLFNFDGDFDAIKFHECIQIVD